MGTLDFDNKQFWFVTSVHRETLLAKNAGLRACDQSLRWVTRKHTKAVKLRQFATQSAEQEFKKYFIAEFELPEHIIYPKGLTPREFQLESVKHILTRSPAYDADEAGLGKTPTSIICMNTVPGKTLVICPPYLKYNWEKEIERWRMHYLPLTQVITHSEEYFQEWANIIVLPDSLLAKPKIQAEIKKFIWKWIFIDEAHRFKDEKRKRTHALYRHCLPHSERVVFLSGTPMPNRPLELYSLLKNVAGEVIEGMSPEEYGKRYCAGKLITYRTQWGTKQAWDFRGQSNMKELRARLRDKFMIRHLKKDVLKELPEKTRQIIFLDQPKSLVPYEKRLLAKLSLDDIMDDDFTVGDIAHYRKLMGQAKIEPALAIIKDLLESSKEKLVVFAHHIEVVEQLTEKLKEFAALKIRGGMTAREKHEAVTLFQNDKRHRVIIGNMDSMGTGLTLTKAPRVVVVEPSWVSGINEQAEDRIHRMTQKQFVYIQYLVLRNSLDERILSQVMLKAEAITELMG